MSGESINWDSYKSLYGTSWRKTQSFGKGYNNSYILYCHSFSASQSISGSGLWGYQEGSFYVDYLDPYTGGWVNVYGWSSDGRGGSYGSSWSFQHNTNSSSSGDRPELSIWRLRIYIGNNDGSGSASVSWGGMSTYDANKSRYTSYFQKHRIIGIPLDTPNNSLQWSYKNNALRGTVITTSNGYQVTVDPTDI